MGLVGRYHTPVEDSISHAVGVIDTPHAELHAGQSFSVLVRKSGGSAASASLLLRTPAAGRAHTVFRFACNVLAEFTVYESSTLTASGTLLATIRNRDRVSGAAAATVIARSTATVSALGTLLVGGLTGSTGVASAKGAGETGTRDEFILKASTDYVVRVVFGAASAIAYLGADWYEET